MSIGRTVPILRVRHRRLETELETISFANLTFRGLRRRDLLRDSNRIRLIVTVNAEIIVEANRYPKLAKIVCENWATLDGQWPYLLAKWKSDRNDLEKISGSDFVYELCAYAAEQGRKIFLLGATANVNRESCRRLRRHFGVECAGFSPPVMEFPFSSASDREIWRHLEAFRPDILVVCFGSPKQEFWADLHKSELEGIGVRWVIGAGGTLDFIAGTIRRAPVLLQRMGLEGVWRLVLEPRLRIARFFRAFQFLRYV